MNRSRICAGLALGLGLTCLGCGPEPADSIETDSSFALQLLSGDVWHLDIDELGYAMSASTLLWPGVTDTKCGVWYEYPSGDTHYMEYDFQVDAFLYDAEGFYLILSSDELDLTFEVEADYLPQDPDDPLGNHLWTEGEMTIYYGPFTESLPVGTNPPETAIWEVFYLS